MQRRCFQCGSVALRPDIKGTELPRFQGKVSSLANILIPIDCATTLPLTVFGRPFVKRFALCYRSVVCLSVCLSVCPVLSCLSVTCVHCGQMVVRIKTKLGMQVGLGPRHIVLDGDPAPPPPKGHSPPTIFGPYLLRPNGCMDQDVTN